MNDEHYPAGTPGGKGGQFKPKHSGAVLDVSDLDAVFRFVANSNYTREDRVKAAELAGVLWDNKYINHKDIKLLRRFYNDIEFYTPTFINEFKDGVEKLVDGKVEENYDSKADRTGIDFFITKNGKVFKTFDLKTIVNQDNLEFPMFFMDENGSSQYGWATTIGSMYKQNSDYAFMFADTATIGEHKLGVYDPVCAFLSKEELFKTVKAKSGFDQNELGRFVDNLRKLSSNEMKQFLDKKIVMRTGNKFKIGLKNNFALIGQVDNNLRLVGLKLTLPNKDARKMLEDYMI